MIVPHYFSSRSLVVVFNLSSLIVSYSLIAIPCSSLLFQVPTRASIIITPRRTVKTFSRSNISAPTIRFASNNNSIDIADLKPRDSPIDSSPEERKTEEIKPKLSKQKNQAKRERPRIPVLQYHDNWVCVSKPAGLTVHRSANTSRRQLVLSSLLKRQLSRKVFPVHRLDHRTSGAILFAFDSKTCSLLNQALVFDGEKIEKKKDARDLEQNDDRILHEAEETLNGDDASRNYVSTYTEDISNTEDDDKKFLINGNPIQKSTKEYIALLRGDWKRKFGNDKEVIVDKPLKVKGITKDAKTIFKLLSSTPGRNDENAKQLNDEYYYSPAACSLVLCTPLTGRTHQIRRHAYAMGLPIIGDSEHGDSKINRWWRQNRHLDRLFLHCFNLDLPPLQSMEYLVNATKSEVVESFNDDTTMNDISVELLESNRVVCTAPLTEDLTKVLNHDDLIDLWMEAKTNDSRLSLLPYDNRGGTYGRNFHKKLKEGSK